MKKRPEFHNPDGLSEKELGKYRLLLKGERPEKGDLVRTSAGSWLRTANWRKGEPVASNATYRTKRPLPEEKEAGRTKQERIVLGLFYQTSEAGRSRTKRIAALTGFLKAKISWHGTGGDVTEADKLGMLEEEYLIKIGVRRRG